jgi:cysteine desulfurase / selenocysteine lyase
VIDAMARALGEDYATVHRGVYTRSAEMTLAYEAARRTVARFIGGREDELVFTRGATEAINLVAHSWGRANLKPGDRILLSQARAPFEHRALADAGAAKWAPTSTSAR